MLAYMIAIHLERTGTKKAVQDEGGEIRTTSRIINDLRKELQTSQDTIQDLRTRITELEGLIGTELQTECTEEEAPEEGAPTDEDTESRTRAR